MQSARAFILAGSCAFIFSLPTTLQAVVTEPVQADSSIRRENPSIIPFTVSLSKFKSSLILPFTVHDETLLQSNAVIKKRVANSIKREDVEPLQIVLTNQSASIENMATQLAKPNKTSELSHFLQTKWASGIPVPDRPSSHLVTLTKEAFKLVNPQAFAKLYPRVHHRLELDSVSIANQSSTRDELEQQVKPYLSEEERRVLELKLRNHMPILLDQDLLPTFARHMIKRFTAFRGPNCFHAALAFQSPRLTSSPHVNYKAEEGYHRAMINHDELWRVLGINFYEINPKDAPLKYGDMIVFFDVPKANTSNNVTANSNNFTVAPQLVPTSEIDYRWIRHASTYLFNGYTFSKGSKSANTPYAVRTLAEEWETWKHFSNGLGVKIYRRSSPTPTPALAKVSSDWLY